MAKKVTEKQPRRKSTKKSITEPKKTAWYKMRRNIHNLSQRRQQFLARRPHRSFKLTRRRDYKRKLLVPGYWAFTVQVLTLLWKNKKTFVALVLLFSVLTIILSSMMSQDTYQQLKDAISSVREDGTLSGFYETFGLFTGVLISYVSGANTTNQSQQAIGALLGLFAWLTTIWLVRAISAKQKPKMRDGLYSSGSPVLALLILALVVAIQMIPAAIALIIYSALDASGALSQTAILMAAGGAAVLIATMSAYWIVGTLFSMVIVTLPGMYPLRALKLAGDIVTGRRIRILLRLFWLFVVLAIVWIVVLVPIIFFDGVLKGWLPALQWLPIVPIFGLLLVNVSIVIFAAYTYLFYRKVVESDSKSSAN